MGKAQDKNIIKSDSTRSRNFNYSKGACTLNFTLRTDVKIELKDFLELLKVAMKDVEEEIKNV